MTSSQAIDCVLHDWHVTCTVGQKQAADALVSEVLWLRNQLTAIVFIVNNGIDSRVETLSADQKSESK